MTITNLSTVQSAQNVQSLHRHQAGPAGLEQKRPTASLQDTVSFSEEALRLSDAAKTTESTKIRFDLVNRIKAEIAAGTYDTPDKMDVAIERMASRIF
ncbi:MAG: flagellar biosynthesis anti-sigma factor FlgM [Planctomycetaceae bacterium]|nr:flagellar biosynthesis anti-sigma factor FlgM [Planctomycetaceae bacterium]